ncbi:DUF1801 domain-containing protein [Lacinutrix sp. MEBiC02595]
MNPAEQYIINQPEPYRSILMHLQTVIAHTLPEAELKFKWRIPCYYINNKPICYLYASAKKEFVDVGFWHAAHLSKKYEVYLVSENRKLVKSLRYRTLEEIEDTVFIGILQEVYINKDKSFYKRK